MGKYRQLLNERKTVSVQRFQKLAGLLKESDLETNETAMLKALTNEWLKNGGSQKIEAAMKKDLEEYYASGQHESGDEDGMYSVPPSETEFAGAEWMLDQYLENVLENLQDADLKQRMLDGEAPKELYDAVGQELEIEARKMFDDVDSEARHDVEDSISLQKDPYSYYGVRRSDFY